VKITLMIAFMIAIADYGAVLVLLGCLPCLGMSVYCWQVVLAAYRQVQVEDTGTQEVNPVRSTASHSSLTSIKDGINRVIGGTPPPPYEAVTVTINDTVDKTSVENEMMTSGGEDKIPRTNLQIKNYRIAEENEMVQTSAENTSTRTPRQDEKEASGPDAISCPPSPTTSLMELLYETKDILHPLSPKFEGGIRPINLNITSLDKFKKVSPSDSNITILENTNAHSQHEPTASSPQTQENTDKPVSQVSLHSPTSHSSSNQSLHSLPASCSLHQNTNQKSHQDLTSSFAQHPSDLTCSVETGEVSSNIASCVDGVDGDTISILSDDTSSMSTTSINSNLTANAI